MLPVFHPPAILYIFPLLDDHRMIQYSCHVVLSLCGQVAEGEAAQVSVLKLCTPDPERRIRTTTGWRRYASDQWP